MGHAVAAAGAIPHPHPHRRRECHRDGAIERCSAALAFWIEDGRSTLRGKGRRKCSYFYYDRHNRTGNVATTWSAKLSELAWVPCDDRELRRPRDVLPQPDPAREGVPVAELSPDLLSILEQEGVRFGSAIPEATPLHRLSMTGSRLDAEALAHLLHECREWVTTNENRWSFAQAARELGIPSNDGKRVPFHRIVRQVGGGERLRGALGGWIVPLDRIDETLRAELDHSDFPCRFPDTTTGHQALAYLREVWARARSSSQGLANEVRDVLLRTWTIDVTKARRLKLLDMVAVLNSSGAPDTQAGDVETIVEPLPSDGLEVEFLSRDGRTRHIGTLSIGDVLVLNRERTRVA